VIVHGPLLLLVGFVVLTGLGIGACFAHLSSWTIAMARPGEEELTASCIPTMQSLGLAFGAATAGAIANAAGLATGVSPAVIAVVATWVYGLCILAPAAIVMLSLRLLWLHSKRPSLPARDMHVTKDI
jgi:hypothetical protein